MIAHRFLRGMMALCLFLQSWAAHADVADGERSAWKVSAVKALPRKLQITLRTGRVLFVPASKHQCSFDGVQIASDGLTVGWTVGASAEDPRDPECGPKSNYVAAGPVLWRAGKVLHRFPEAAAGLAWSFYQGGKMVAIHAGPLHFDNEQSCTLYDAASGQVLKQWSRSLKADPPDWAAGIVED